MTPATDSTMTAFSGMSTHHVAISSTDTHGGDDVTTHVNGVVATGVPGHAQQHMETGDTDSRTADLYDGGEDEEDADDDEEPLVVNIVSPECCRRPDPISAPKPPLSLPRLALSSPSPQTVTPPSSSPRLSPNQRTMTSPPPSFYLETTSSPCPPRMTSSSPLPCHRKMSPTPNPQTTTRVPSVGGVSVTSKPSHVSPPLSHSLQEPPPKKSSSPASKSASE